MAKVISKATEQDAETESELDDIEDDENRLSEEEEFPISEDSSDDEDEEVTEKKKGWADSMAKILNSEKTEVLSKAEKIEDLEKRKKKQQKSYNFEIEGEVKKENETKPSEEALQRAMEKRKRKEKRSNKMKALNLRLKPSIADADRERTLRKIATKGVVQLFNAVKIQSADLEQKLQSTKLGSKRDEIIRSADNKKHFLDTLMSGPRARSELVDKGVKKEKFDASSSDDDERGNNSKKSTTWSALRDDFMTGKKVGWDKDDSEEDESENNEMESESD